MKNADKMPFDPTPEEAAEELLAPEDSPTVDQELLASLCREKVCPQCPELTQKHEEMLRILAESENFKKRLTREKEDFCKFATGSLLEDIIPALDNLALALGHGPKNEACQGLLLGVEMSIKIFHDTLKKHGLEVVGQEGEVFNPAVHEAIGQEERADLEDGTVCRLLQNGYVLNNRLLRPAKVLVSRKCS